MSDSFITMIDTIQKMRNPKGFTLTELMITVAIIAILAAIAVPIYTHYVYRSKQVEAKTLLMTIKAEQEEYRAEFQVYTSDITDLTQSNQLNSSAKWYNLTIPTANTTGFQAEARGYLADGHPEDVWFITHQEMYALHTGSEGVY
jgi:type IV pilus assembly protein PilE